MVRKTLEELRHQAGFDGKDSGAVVWSTHTRDGKSAGVKFNRIEVQNEIRLSPGTMGRTKYYA